MQIFLTASLRVRLQYGTFIRAKRGHLSGQVGDICQGQKGTFVGISRGHLSRLGRQHIVNGEKLDKKSRFSA